MRTGGIPFGVVVLDRTVGRTLLASAAVLVVAFTVSRFPEIGTPFGNELVPWPLLPCVAPLMLFAGLQGDIPTLERTSRRGPLLPLVLRTGTALLAIAVVAAVIAQRAPTDGLSAHGAVAWRNAAIITGVTLASACVLPATVSWLPGTGYLVINAAVGVPAGGEALPWTLLLRVGDDGTARALAVAVLLAGLAFTMRRAGGRRLRPVAPESSRPIVPSDHTGDPVVPERPGTPT